MEWPEPAPARRTLILAIIVAVAIVIARAVSSARGDNAQLRAPNAKDVATLAGVAPATDTTNATAPVPPPFAVADSMGGHSGKVRFRTLTRASATTLSGFIDAAHANYQLKDNAAIYQQSSGFKPVPFAQMGLRKPNANVKRYSAADKF